jgi:hypothetical protein
VEVVGGGLPKFDGVTVREDLFDEVKLDARSVRSEGANKGGKRGSSGRDGTASV